MGYWIASQCTYCCVHELLLNSHELYQSSHITKAFLITMNSKFSTPPDHISFPVVDSDDKSGSQVPHSRPLRTYVVFFLPGNPCVVEFYRTFLTLLYHSLSVDASICKTQIQVQAVSLRGFECAQDQELVSDLCVNLVSLVSLKRMG